MMLCTFYYLDLAWVVPIPAPHDLIFFVLIVVWFSSDTVHFVYIHTEFFFVYMILV